MTDSKPDAIIFDYGRVIIGPFDRVNFESSLQFLASDYGFESGQNLWNHIYISPAWEKAKRGRISYEAFWEDRLGSLGIKTAEGQKAFKQRLFEHWQIYPAMRALMADLKKEGQRLAVLSNTARRGFREYLEIRRGFVNTFDVITSSAEVGYAKPEPEIYRLTLEKLNLSPEKTLFVDDLERNTKAATKLGIPSVVYTDSAKLIAEFQRRGIL